MKKLILDKRKIRIYFLVGIGASSLILGFAQGALKLPKTTARIIFFVYVLTMLGVYYYVNMKWFRAFMHEIDLLQPILTVYKKPSKYRQELTFLMGEPKSAQLKTVYNMGICASYCVEENWEMAKESLLAVPYKKIFGLQKIAYNADLAYVHFRMNEDEEAFSIIDNNRAEFIKCSGMDRIGALIMCVFIIELIKKNDKEKAREMFVQTKERWQQKALEDEYAYIENLLK